MSSSKNTPSKTAGQMHSMKGAIKETVGGAINSADLKTRGREEHQLGNAEVREAKVANSGTGRNTGSGAEPFSGSNLGQYEDRNTGSTLAGGAGAGAPYNQTRTDARAYSGGPTGGAMAQGLAATGGATGMAGLGPGSAGYDGLSGNDMNATQNPGRGVQHQGLAGDGLAERQTKQDLKEWERNAF